MARRPLVPRRRLIRRPGLLLAVGAAALVAFLYYRPVTQYFRTQAAVDQRSAEVQRLSAEKRRLQRRLRLDERGGTLVREARRLGLVRPGERLFIVKGLEHWRRARARDGVR